MGRCWWPGRQLGWTTPSTFDMMGRGPARSIGCSEDGPRPGRAHHIFETSRPGPSFLEISRPGPARPITWLRGPLGTGSMGRPDLLRGPVREFHGLADGPVDVLSRSKKV